MDSTTTPTAATTEILQTVVSTELGDKIRADAELDAKAEARSRPSTSNTIARILSAHYAAKGGKRKGKARS